MGKAGFVRQSGLVVFFIHLIALTAFSQQRIISGNHLIAHRGGIVDSTSAENSKEALERAIDRGYWMVESDLRVTKDGVLITYHDQTFKRSFGLDSAVTDMTWEQIRRLKSAKGYQVMLFEDLLRLSKGRIGIMIDNKIRGNDNVLFAKVINLLKRYDLYKNALMIGTEESAAFFTGKIKLSCTRSQLETNMRKPGYRSSDFYLFSGDISRNDVLWAKKHKILAVGVLNAWAIKSPDADHVASQKANQLLAAGLSHFQIDSVFEYLFNH
ncbi:glycerophosphodiester phosphodiesterase family protein [Pedobacter sp. MC2016-24]|uniref:glycerophosphodiester phosphodiesterase n=1 Tax=Pedobacter sp. MC2016-24 TaxID=2780090 RepID=UPI00187E91B3|nr:glycerophosphodiester phosphodiesterase family protein [Pedobacter sp. MC2016-24]MBE9601592.1 glycerophosphodiester phosphodiesterase family protein [Pedobacter sp. MC2016-24]